jgi:signal peptidase II
MTTRTLGLITAALIFAADQFAKYMVTVPFDLKARGQIEILPFFNLTWVENYGVSMGFLTADTALGKWLLIALTGAIAVGVLVWIWREKNRQDVLALGMILGGALGNILDRVRFGHVVDFADFQALYFPWVFNVADAAITMGVVILLLRALLVREKPKVSADA